MAIGTAGYTAMLAVMALERHGLKPDSGAGGGDRRGRRRRLGRGRAAGQARLPGDRLDRAAAGGRLPQGARRQPRSSTARNSPGPPKPLAKERWAGGINSVGSTTLANVLSMTKYGGAVAACGLAGGMDLPSSVAPFILRGVSLFGIDSVQCPPKLRQEAWRRLASDLDRGKLEAMTTRDRPAGGDRSRRNHPRRPGPGPDRGQDPVKAFRIWLRSSGMIGASRMVTERLTALSRAWQFESGVGDVGESLAVWPSFWRLLVRAGTGQRPRKCRADEARHFIAGKQFAYQCFEGTNGNGRIYPDGSVAGYIQIRRHAGRRASWCCPPARCG